MKRKVLTVCLGALVLVVAAIAVYRLVIRKSIPEASREEQVALILERNGCLVCHSTDAELPPLRLCIPVAGSSGEAV